MLGVLRKYQRFLFIVICLAMVSTFMFVGNGARTKEHSKDAIEFQLLDKKNLHRSQVDQAIDFLTFETKDQKKAVESTFLWSDSFIEKDFLKSEFAAELALFYEKDLSDSYEKKVKKEKKFKTYIHPFFPELSIECIWQKFHPELKKKFDLWKKNETSFTKHFFQDRVQLYLEQKKFPADLSKQIILYQESRWMPEKEPSILDQDLALFGYHSLKDWLGDDFLRILVKTVFNAAIVAKEKGYCVSDQEAKADLIYHQYASKKGIQKQNKATKADLEQATISFQDQIRTIGWSEKELIRFWKKILLFRKLFAHLGQLPLLDAAVYQDFGNFAAKNTQIDLYQLPKEMQFSSFEALQQFQIYLEAVANDFSLTSDFLPKEYCDVEKILKNTPELVKNRYLVKIKYVDKENLLVKVGIKQSLDWLLDVHHQEMIQQHFSDLPIFSSFPKYILGNEEEWMYLVGIWKKENPKESVLLDQFIHEQILAQNPDWVMQELEKIESQEKEIDLPFKGACKDLVGIPDCKKWIDLFENALKTSLENSLETSSQSIIIDHQPNQRYVHQIELIHKCADKQILSFAEAKKAGIWHIFLKKRLQQKYEQIKKEKKLEHNQKFSSLSGAWKPFELVKDQVAQIVFQPLLEKIALSSSQLEKKSPENKKTDSLHLLVAKRFQKYLFEQREIHEKNQKTTLEDSFSLLSNQWKLEKQNIHLKRCDLHPFLNAKQMADAPINSWSLVETIKNKEQAAHSYFYHVVEHQKDEEAFIPLFDEAQNILNKSCCIHLFKEVLIKQHALEKPEEK